MSSSAFDEEISKLVRECTSQDLRDKLTALNLSTSGAKKALAKRLLENSPNQDAAVANLELQDLRRKLGLHGDTVSDLKDNGFRTMSDIKKLKNSPSFPANMDFIRLLRDRASVIDELMSSSQPNPLPSSIPQPPVINHPQGLQRPQDLRGLIQSRRNSTGDDYASGESVIFEDNHAPIELSTKARDLPRPHDRVYNNVTSTDKSKPPA